MKKLYSLLLITLLTIVLLAGCAGATKQTQEGKQADSAKVTSTFPVTIKDALDNEVVIKQKPERIVSLMPSNTEIAYSLGLGKEIVGVSDYDNYPEDTRNKEKIGGQEFNTEKIIGLKPDLVLAHASSALIVKDALKQLKDAGIPVLVIANAENFETVYNTIDMIGKATGTNKKTDEVIKGMKDKMAAIQEKAASIKDKKKVYIEVSPAPDIYTTGKNTFMDEMLASIQTKNVAGDQQGWIKVDQEAIIQKNPDVVITTYGYYVKNPVEQVLSRKGWDNINAVKNKQVIDVNSDIMNRPGPRVVEGVEALAKAIYPDVFK
ncbi:ABC transporter substrate-binding protein [Bacillus sp. USDA818B3_A]|uniref:ABC transporter substrate-binding protein n=1 Tax=Bacillus sp. USDA818B3_A TaxID=2698834 RepID=UPI001368E9F8|nr:ABC transporter substrate-binding protein [Bacillus sp. USDA818B3_A]